MEFQVEDAASSADSESLDQSSSDLTDTLLFTFVDNKEDLVVVITGIITGGFVCILVLTAVSLTIRKCMGTHSTPLPLSYGSSQWMRKKIPILFAGNGRGRRRKSTDVHSNGSNGDINNSLSQGGKHTKDILNSFACIACGALLIGESPLSRWLKLWRDGWAADRDDGDAPSPKATAFK